MREAETSVKEEEEAEVVEGLDVEVVQQAAVEVAEPMDVPTWHKCLTSQQIQQRRKVHTIVILFRNLTMINGLLFSVFCHLKNQKMQRVVKS